MYLVEGLVHCSKMGRAVLTVPTVPSKLLSLLPYFIWGKEGTCRLRETVTAEAVVNYLITNKHSACFFITFLPTVLAHIQCGKITA